MKKDIEIHEPILESVMASQEELISVAEDDTNEVREEVASIKERFDKLKEDVDEKLKKTSVVDEVVDKISEIQAKQRTFCGDAGRMLDFMAPIGNDIEKAKVQAEEIEVLI